MLRLHIRESQFDVWWFSMQSKVMPAVQIRAAVWMSNEWQLRGVFATRQGARKCETIRATATDWFLTLKILTASFQWFPRVKLWEKGERQKTKKNVRRPENQCQDLQSAHQKSRVPHWLISRSSRFESMKSPTQVLSTIHDMMLPFIMRWIHITSGQLNRHVKTIL